MRRLALVVVCTITAFTVGALAPASAAPAGRVSYRPPVAGPIVDEFRPPPEDWNAGNRGIDYAPPPGTPVKASADGEVTFAGQVGGKLHVVVLHADGIRTTYAFLDSIAVHRGDRVRQGQTVGGSGAEGLHFGARVGDEYIDPRTLFDDEPPHVFLVPDEARRPGTEPEERRGLVAFLGKAAKAGRDFVGVLVNQAKDEIVSTIEEYAGLAHYARRFNPLTLAWEVGRTGWDYYQQRNDCTPADVAPRPLPERRVAVLVAGMGSTSEKGDSVDDVDPSDLGYDDHVRFSYLGGTTEENTYTKGDTTTDLRLEGERLRDLLADMERRYPGVPIDIIAHSQGGIIAREALSHGYDDGDRKLPPVRNIVTLATPHQGTDVATALTMLGHTTVGDTAMQAVGATNTTPLDPTGDSIAQLSEASLYLWQLNHTPLPEGVQLTSIGSRGDLLVPGVHTRAPGARNVMVSLDGVWSDHRDLPGSPEGRREVGLAIAGMPPTCQSLTNMLADYWVSNAIATVEDLAGAAVYGGAKRIDKKLEGEDLTRRDPDPPPRPPHTSPPPVRP